LTIKGIVPNKISAWQLSSSLSIHPQIRDHRHLCLLILSEAKAVAQRMAKWLPFRFCRREGVVAKKSLETAHASRMPAVFFIL